MLNKDTRRRMRVVAVHCIILYWILSWWSSPSFICTVLSFPIFLFILCSPDTLDLEWSSAFSFFVSHLTSSHFTFTSHLHLLLLHFTSLHFRFGPGAGNGPQSHTKGLFFVEWLRATVKTGWASTELGGAEKTLVCPGSSLWETKGELSMYSYF